MNAQEVIEALGGVAAVSRQLKSPKTRRKHISVQALYKWRRVPVSRVHEFVAISGGKFTAAQLRPDIFGKTA